MTDLHLVAFLANAHDEAEQVLAVATCNAFGEWHTTCDQRVWPYWSQPLDLLIDWELARIHDRGLPSSPPPGWIDHLHGEAQAYAAKRQADLRPSGLAALLASAKPKAVPTVPIARRGF